MPGSNATSCPARYLKDGSGACCQWNGISPLLRTSVHIQELIRTHQRMAERGEAEEFGSGIGFLGADR